MKILALLSVSLAVALGVTPGKVPGPMVEDGSPDLVPEQEVQTRGGHHCPGLSHDGRCYRFFRGPRRGGDAEGFCQRLAAGGHLASITSLHLQLRLVHLIQTSNGAPTPVWVGGRRYFTTGRFVWLDGSRWVYANWLPGKPRPTSNIDNCVEMLANGRFNDQRCAQARAFICSYPG